MASHVQKFRSKDRTMPAIMFFFSMYFGNFEYVFQELHFCGTQTTLLSHHYLQLVVLTRSPELMVSHRPSTPPPQPCRVRPFIVLGVVTSFAVLLPLAVGLWLTAHLMRLASGLGPLPVTSKHGCAGCSFQLPVCLDCALCFCGTLRQHAVRPEVPLMKPTHKTPPVH